MNDAPPRRIWLCADDYGMAEGVNRAIRDLISRGTQALANTSPAPGGPPHGARDGYNGGSFFLALNADSQVEFNPQQVQVESVVWPSLPQSDTNGTLATLTINGEPTRMRFVHQVFQQRQSASRVAVGPSGKRNQGPVVEPNAEARHTA